MCRQESSGRCLLVLAPTSRKGNPNAQTECGNARGFFPPHPCFPPLPLPFPPRCPSPQQYCGSHISLQEPKLLEGATFVCSQCCYHSQRLGLTPIAFILSLSPLSLFGQYVSKLTEVHGRVSSLAQRLKSVPRGPKNTREIMKRKEVPPPHKGFVAGGVCIHKFLGLSATYTCMAFSQ